MAIEITVHRKIYDEFRKEFDIDIKDAKTYCGKVTFTTRSAPADISHWNAWLASRKFAGLAAPVFAGGHAVLLHRPQQTPGLPAAQRSRITASWPAAIYPHIQAYINGARMELLEGDGHAVALAPRSPHAHAQILAVADAYGLKVRRGAQVPSGHVRGTLSAAGGAIGAFDDARRALAAAATSLLGDDVLVAQVPGRGTCVTYLALEALHARGVDPTRLPNRIGDYPIRWACAGGADLRTTDADCDTWAALAQGVRRTAIARRLADARAAAAATAGAATAAEAAPGAGLAGAAGAWH